ncbi:MAG: hypothetical protein ACREEB_18150 [Caulobacteraceae bacterium]
MSEPGVLARLGEILRQSGAWLSRHRRLVRRVALSVVLPIFLGGLILAARSIPDLYERLQLAPFLALLLIAVPATIVLNAVETDLLFRMAGHPARWTEVLETTIHGSAANLLPIPGSALVRAGAMKTGGVAIRHSSRFILCFAGVWGGVTFAYSGAALALQRQHQVGAALTALGLVALAACVGLLRRLGAQWAEVGRLVVVRVSSLPLEALRLMLAAWALGAKVSLAQASAFTVASFIGTGISIVPAGLGIREALIAAISPLVGVSSSMGFLSATVDRVAAMCALAAAVALLALFRRAGPGKAEKDGRSCQLEDKEFRK